VSDYTTTTTKPSTGNNFPDVFTLIQQDLSDRGNPSEAILLVSKDFEGRRQYGLKKYGANLQPFDNNDTLREAYQEALDQVVYWRQLILERDHSIDPESWQLVHELLAYVPRDSETFYRAIDWLRRSGSSQLCEAKGVA
jgi:hypothetical protein